MVLLLAGLLACGGKSEEADSGPLTPEERWGPPTDTIPSFYGSVPKNVIMLSIDTWRRDSLTRYGGPTVMPYMDELAMTGFTADDHITVSNWTMHGTSSTLAGAYPLDLGWVPSLPTATRTEMPDEPTLLAEALGEAGYWSVLMSGNSWLSPEWNNTQGYDYAESPEDYDFALMLAEQAYDRLGDAQRADEADGPFFLHLHLMEPHAAYRPPKEYLSALDDLEPLFIDLEDRDEQYMSNVDWLFWDDEQQELYKQHLWARYRGELTYTDDLVRTLLAEAGARGLLEDTMVVVWNDHGESMLERGIATHAWTLYGTENDGIWLMWAPNIVPGTWDGPTTSIDIAPTILDLLDLPIPASMGGTPLGDAAEDRARYMWAHARGPSELGVLKDGWKLFYQLDGSAWLFDRNTDPLESENLWSEDDPSSHPKVAELWPLLLPRIQKAADLTGYEPVWPPGLAPE